MHCDERRGSIGECRVSISPSESNGSFQLCPISTAENVIWGSPGIDNPLNTDPCQGRLKDRSSRSLLASLEIYVSICRWKIKGIFVKVLRAALK